MQSDLPETVYVRSDDDEEGLFLAFGSRMEAVDENGPTEIGEYKLVRKQVFEKILNEVEEIKP
jgi:hypothetical protein